MGMVFWLFSVLLSTLTTLLIAVSRHQRLVCLSLNGPQCTLTLRFFPKGNKLHQGLPQEQCQAVESTTEESDSTAEQAKALESTEESDSTAEQAKAKRAEEAKSLLGAGLTRREAAVEAGMKSPLLAALAGSPGLSTSHVDNAVALGSTAPTATSTTSPTAVQQSSKATSPTGRRGSTSRVRCIGNFDSVLGTYEKERGWFQTAADAANARQCLFSDVCYDLKVEDWVFYTTRRNARAGAGLLHQSQTALPDIRSFDANTGPQYKFRHRKAEGDNHDADFVPLGHGFSVSEDLQPEKRKAWRFSSHYRTASTGTATLSSLEDDTGGPSEGDQKSTTFPRSFTPMIVEAGTTTKTKFLDDGVYMLTQPKYLDNVGHALEDGVMNLLATLFKFGVYTPCPNIILVQSCAELFLREAKGEKRTKLCQKFVKDFFGVLSGNCTDTSAAAATTAKNNNNPQILSQQSSTGALQLWDVLRTAKEEQYDQVCFKNLVVGGSHSVYQRWSGLATDGKEPFLRLLRAKFYAYFGLPVDGNRPKTHQIVLVKKTGKAGSEGKAKNSRAIANFQQVHDYLVQRYKGGSKKPASNTAAEPGVVVPTLGLPPSTSTAPAEAASASHISRFCVTSWSELSLKNQLQVLQKTTVVISPAGGISGLLPFLPDGSYAILLNYQESLSQFPMGVTLSFFAGFLSKVADYFISSKKTTPTDGSRSSSGASDPASDIRAIEQKISSYQTMNPLHRWFPSYQRFFRGWGFHGECPGCSWTMEAELWQHVPWVEKLFYQTWDTSGDRSADVVVDVKRMEQLLQQALRNYEFG
ncbi:unnamed protein product [Amoebophrya sp. A120]|nr:unnamed protein product [Amoebophrya sp. A120]|eukprot:GSA120T00010151001.1